MCKEIVDMYDYEGVVYAVYEDERGETYEEVYGVLSNDESKNSDYVVDVSGNYDG